MIKLLESKEIRRIFAVLLVAVMLVGVTAVVYAANIIVDGNGAEWPGGSLVHTDCNENGANAINCDPTDDIPDQFDIGNVYITNNSTTFFMRFDTYAATNWFPPFTSGAFAEICFNADNNLATGVTFPNCSSQPGVDHVLRIDYVSAGPVLSATLSDCSGVSCMPNAGATVSAANNGGAVNEIEIDLVDLGFTLSPTAICPDGVTTAQPCIMPMAMYFDNQTTPPDDNVPFSGTFQAEVGGGSPTAVTLQNVSASGQSAVLPFTLGAFGLIIVSAGLVINRKRQAVK